MHDPMVLATTIRRPWPRRNRLGGRHYYPSLVDVWHNEPDGRDAGQVCGYPPHDARKLVPWLWTHRRHLSVRVIPWMTFSRWRWSRCAHCKGRFRWGEAPISHQWNGAGPSRNGEPGVYHRECSSVVSLRAHLGEAREALRALGVDATDLELHGLDSTKAWRIIYYATPQERAAS